MHWISNEKYHFFFRLSIRFLLAMPSQLKILTLLAMLIIKQLRWFYFHEWCSLHWSVWISFQVAFTACSNIHLLINRLGEQELCQQGKENIREVLNSRTIPKRAFTYVTQGVGRSLKAARIVRVLALHFFPPPCRCLYFRSRIRSPWFLGARAVLAEAWRSGLPRAVQV